MGYIVAYTQVAKLISQQCKAYVVSLVEQESELRELYQSQYYLNLPVFPETLLVLPPRKEVKFTIDVALGNELISKATYRMASAKLKELKV